MYEGNVIFNNDIKFQRGFAILTCFTVVFLPLAILWLFKLRAPTETYMGTVTNKVTQTKHITAGRGSGIINEYFLTVETRKFGVSANIYNIVKVGDFVTVGYRKDLVYYVK
jgi:hypothetical protein